MDRYFQAFEHGTIPEDTCAPRIAALGEQTKALEARASELATLADSEPVQRISEADLDAIRQRVRDALDDGGPMRVKAILQELTDEIRIDARDAIEPTFLVPAVQPPSRTMAVVERLSNQEVQGTLAHLSEKLAGLRRDGSRPRPAVPQRLRARRPGWVLTAIVQVLADKGAPMRAKDIHAAVEASLGEPVAWSSIRTALASHASGSSPRVVRVARGRYALCDPLVTG